MIERPMVGSCPDENVLTDLVEGRLDAGHHKRVHAHVDACTACEGLLVELASILEDRSHSAPGKRDPAGLRGGSLGRYEILDVLGSGGMGVVYLAFDPALNRQVALKVLRSSQGQAQHRILREARAMAQLSHPNVVQVHEVGEHEHGRYIAMELVRGKTLNAWAKGRPWRDRFKACVQAGEGLIAAHAAGLIHRDFKPTNVLCGDDGRVRVTDFGLVAVGLDPSAQETTHAAIDQAEALTLTGSVMGTPAYMAPEQLRAQSDARSDQFSFCVTVWEILSGRRPHEPSHAPDDPNAARADTSRWPDDAPRVPQAVIKVLRTGLAHEPSKRWPSMEVLLARLDKAAAPRVPARLLGLGVVLVAIIGGVVGYSHYQDSLRAETCAARAGVIDATWDAKRQAQARAAMLATGSFAQPVWEHTKAELDRYVATWRATFAETCEAALVRRQQSSPLVQFQSQCLERARVELAGVTQVLAAADTRVVQRSRKLLGGLPQISRCLDSERLPPGVQQPQANEAAAVDEVRLLLAETTAQRRAGWPAQASDTLDRAEELANTLSYAPIRTKINLLRGRVLDDLGHYKQSETALREALQSAAIWHQWDELQTASQMLMFVVGNRLRQVKQGLRYRELAVGLATGDAGALASVRNMYGTVLQANAKYEAAATEYRESLRMWDIALASMPADSLLHDNPLRVRGNLAFTLASQGKYAEAELENRGLLASWIELVGPRHPAVGHAHNRLANVLTQRGRYAEARVEARQALDVLSTSLGSEHPSVSVVSSRLASILLNQRRFVAAEAAYRQTLQVRRRVLGANHPEIATSHGNLGTALLYQGRLEEAESHFRQALGILQAADGEQHPDTATVLNNLAGVLFHQQKYDEAEAATRSAIESLTKTLGLAHPDIAQSRINLASILSQQGQYEQAEAEYRLALTTFAETVGPKHPTTAWAQISYAEYLLERARPREALPLAELAWNNRQGEGTGGAGAEIGFILARALWENQRLGGGNRVARSTARQRARELAAQAADSFATEGTPEQQELVSAWLVQHP